MCVSCLPASGIPNVARTPPLLLAILILPSFRLTISWLFSQVLAQRINAGYTVTQSNTTGKLQTQSTA